MRSWGIAVGLALAVVALSGCSFGVSTVGMGGSCAEVPSAVCSEQIDRAGRLHPGATNVDVSCGVPVCDRRGGSGTAVVTLRDGSKVVDTFTYTGDPAPVPAPICVNLAPEVCKTIAQQQVDDAPPAKRIVRVKVTCTVARCTDASGETDVEIVFADGSTNSGTYGWETAE